MDGISGVGFFGLDRWPLLLKLYQFHICLSSKALGYLLPLFNIIYMPS